MNGITQNLSNHLQTSTTNTAFPFLVYSPNASSNGQGLNGTATAISSSDFHWNTAKIAHSVRQGEIEINYSPWLRQLVDGIHFMHISGYSKLGASQKHVLGGSIRYLSDGANQTFGVNSDAFQSNDIELLAGYAYQINERSSVGCNAKMLYSDVLASGVVDSTRPPALAGALDISYSYQNSDVGFQHLPAWWGWGVSISNIGNKVNYNDLNAQQFLPGILRLGGSFGLAPKDKHGITLSSDVQKSLSPNYETSTDIGTLQGIGRSLVDSEEGLVGELKELQFGFGLEYNFNGLFQLRSGYHHQHQSIGNMRMVTFGAGANFKAITLNAAYWMSTIQNNPFANTLNVSIGYKFK